MWALTPSPPAFYDDKARISQIAAAPHLAMSTPLLYTCGNLNFIPSLKVSISRSKGMMVVASALVRDTLMSLAGGGAVRRAVHLPALSGSRRAGCSKFRWPKTGKRQRGHCSAIVPTIKSVLPKLSIFKARVSQGRACKPVWTRRFFAQTKYFRQNGGFFRVFAAKLNFSVPKQRCFVSSQPCFARLQRFVVSSQLCFASPQRCYVTSQRYFASSQKCFISLQRCFASLQRCFVSKQKCFVPSQRFFVLKQKYFGSLQECFIPKQKCFGGRCHSPILARL